MVTDEDDEPQLCPMPPPAPPVQKVCPVIVWDGPYRMKCGHIIVNGKCVRHGSVRA